MKKDQPFSAVRLSYSITVNGYMTASSKMNKGKWYTAEEALAEVDEMHKRMRSIIENGVKLEAKMTIPAAVAPQPTCMHGYVGRCIVCEPDSRGAEK